MDQPEYPTTPGEDPPGLTEQDTQRLPDLPPKWHREVQDTADVIDKTAPDPQPREVTDPSDPSWVPAADGALPVSPRTLLPAGTLLPDPPPSGTVGTSLPDPPDSLGDALARDQQLPAAQADTYPDDPERDPEGHA